MKKGKSMTEIDQFLRDENYYNAIFGAATIILSITENKGILYPEDMGIP